MNAFNPAVDLSSDRAYQMLSISPVTLFFRSTILADTTEWLAANEYQLIALNSRSWTALSMHDDLASALSFPQYYGRNLNALDDCLRDVVAQDYGWQPNSTGLVIVFTGYDAFVRSEPQTAQAVLDIFASHSRSATLIGKRLLCLVQSNDPDLKLDPVGASPIWWNSAEWLDSARH